LLTLIFLGWLFVGVIRPSGSHFAQSIPYANTKYWQLPTGSVIAYSQYDPPQDGTSFWHYEFVLNRKRYHKSTKMKNEREALKVASAAFTALVKGEAGIGEPKTVPTLKAFREAFVTAVRAEKQDKPKTVQF